MSAALEILSGLFILAGAAVVGIAGLGLLRLPDPLTRMHAATKAGVVGSGMVMFGVGLSLGTVSAVITGGLGVLFLLATSPIASHALGRAAYTSGAPIAPSTVADALAGILPRNVFDISPARTPRPSGSSPASPSRGESVMSAVELKERQFPAGRTTPAPLRVVTAWLLGGDTQGDASRTALDLARQSGARLVGLSAMDPGLVPDREAVPIGGLAWSRWLVEQRRGRMRERAARAIAEFEALAGDVGAPISIRHEERVQAGLIPIAAGADLLIVPAGVDRLGEPAAFADEIASELSAARIAPVLRVRRRSLAVRRVALVVSNSLGCGRLAQALLRTGLWRDATVVVLPVGTGRSHVLAVAEEQAALLESHGYRVQRGEPIELEGDESAMVERLRTMDAAVLGVLSHRTGWFGALREDVHESAAARVPMVLLP